MVTLTELQDVDVESSVTSSRHSHGGQLIEGLLVPHGEAYVVSDGGSFLAALVEFFSTLNLTTHVHQPEGINSHGVGPSTDYAVAAIVLCCSILSLSDTDGLVNQCCFLPPPDVILVITRHGVLSTDPSAFVNLGSIYTPIVPADLTSWKALAQAIYLFWFDHVSRLSRRNQVFRDYFDEEVYYIDYDDVTPPTCWPGGVPIFGSIRYGDNIIPFKITNWQHYDDYSRVSHIIDHLVVFEMFSVVDSAGPAVEELEDPAVEELEDPAVELEDPDI